jgi:hypothetical protein
VCAPVSRVVSSIINHIVATLPTNQYVVICVSRLKSASFLFESEFSGRGAAEA